MSAPYCYDYPRPAVTVDAVILLRHPVSLKLLLIKRKHEPFQGLWALPGGFVDMHETTEQAVHREVVEETSLTGLSFKRIDIFDAIDRDPRNRVISVAYAAYADTDQEKLIKAEDDAADVQWFNLDDLPDLAFDHALIIQTALDK